MKFLITAFLSLIISAPVLADGEGEPSCLAACSFGDGGWYHLGCLKKADVGTLIRQYNCELDLDVENDPGTCTEIIEGELRDVTHGPIPQAKEQFYAWCKGAGLIPRQGP